ncbi:hypothetical protein [Paraburkholderia caribensis]|uniref:hypothetical protein n=1 Tax=Paraburkholderia caribensis TaxID=75105 RepID=UPI0034D162E3
MRFTHFDDMPSEARASLLPVVEMGEYVGIIEQTRTGSGARSIKTVSHTTLAVLRSLEKPESIGDVFAKLDVRIADIASLVFDGLLEAADHRAAFVSGPKALDIFLKRTRPSIPSGYLSCISREAIDFYARVETATPIDLAWKLYQFNRYPVTPESAARWFRPDFDELMLGRATYAQRRLLGEHFERVLDAERLGWIAWTAKAFRHAKDTSERCKLYVSPRPDQTAWAFREVVDYVPESAATGFKLGVYSHGLMRPDKIVLYFDDFAALRRTHATLESRLSGVPVQGVPFSCQLDARGLFSWGADPRTRGHLSWHSDDSWRMWVCNRLAGALFDGRRAQLSPEDVMRYALVRAELHGVDVQTWARSHFNLPIGPA